MATTAPRITRYTIAAWILAGLVLLLVILLRLLPALLAGLLVYELVHIIAPRLAARSSRGKLAAVSLLALGIVSVLLLGLFGLWLFIQSEAGSLPRLLHKMADILDAARTKLPPWIVAALPPDADSLKETMSSWLRENSHALRIFGGELGHSLVHILIGMVIGAMVSLREAQPRGTAGPLATELLERCTRLGEAFRRIVFAQVRISALNTIFTAIYLLIVLPVMGIDLPFRKTLVAVTFFAGLLPVIGNLISNTVIVVVSLSVAPMVAIGSLGFLVVIHKLEYFLNAKIVGSRINANAWELLVAMLFMEAAFGLPGLVAAPVYYAYLKDELSARGLL
jgi:predicted PurR-regulated permease PerM